MLGLFTDWPVDLRVFELDPSGTQLAFAGDTLPIKCTASNNNLQGLYWYRQEMRVLNNRTAKLELVEDHNDPAMRTVTLRFVILS